MQAHDIDTTETGRLIASDQVEGTAVYNRQGDHLGAIKTVMIDNDGIPPPNPNDDASFLRYPKDSPLSQVPSVNRSMGASVSGN